jgi:hypothetical protein
VRGSQWRLLAPPAPTFFLHHVLQQPAPDLLRHVLHQPCGIVSFSVGRQHCFRFRVALSVLWFFFPGNCTAWETTGASSSCCSIQIHVYRTCATVLICFPPAFFALIIHIILISFHPYLVLTIFTSAASTSKFSLLDCYSSINTIIHYS